MQLANRDLEAQVDELLVSLFRTRMGFAQWFCQRINRARAILPSLQSVSASRNPPRRFAKGQTDLGLHITGDKRCEVLIENKVSHRFEDRQPERYREECQGLVDRKIADVAAAVLVAPQRYIDSIGSVADKFDAFVTYEEMSEWLGGNPLLLKAIERCERGYIAERIPAVCANFEGYAELVRSAYPELRLITKPGNNPAQSRTGQFDSSFAGNNPPGVPYIWLLHQWNEGSAKLLFKGWNTYRNVLGPLIAEDVASEGMLLDPNRSRSKSLGMMIPTPVIDNHGHFGDQREKFIAGLDAILQLRRWYLDNTDVVREWVAQAMALRGRSVL